MMFFKPAASLTFLAVLTSSISPLVASPAPDVNLMKYVPLVRQGLAQAQSFINNNYKIKRSEVEVPSNGTKEALAEKDEKNVPLQKDEKMANATMEVKPEKDQKTEKIEKKEHTHPHEMTEKEEKPLKEEKPVTEETSEQDVVEDLVKRASAFFEDAESQFFKRDLAQTITGGLNINWGRFFKKMIAFIIGFLEGPQGGRGPIILLDLLNHLMFGISKAAAVRDDGSVSTPAPAPQPNPASSTRAARAARLVDTSA